MQKKIAILGCGWLGLPLAARLVKTGHLVKGSTTSPEKRATLEEQGIRPYIFRVGSTFEGEMGDFLKQIYWF